MTTRSGEEAVEIEIKLHIGPRDELRPLFELAGYPPGLVIDGIELRDRVWLDQPVV